MKHQRGLYYKYPCDIFSERGLSDIEQLPYSSKASQLFGHAMKI